MRVDEPSARLSSNPTSTSVKAAAKAIGKSGTWRERCFYLVAFSFERGITAPEVEVRLGLDNPCTTCGCTHRAPKPQNELNTRLGELREWGWVQWLKDSSGNLVERGDREAHVNVLTWDGFYEAKDRYGDQYYFVPDGLITVYL